MVLQAMLESGATPEEIAKVMVEQKLLQAIGTSPGTILAPRMGNKLIQKIHYDIIWIIGMARIQMQILVYSIKWYF